MDLVSLLSYPFREKIKQIRIILIVVNDIENDVMKKKYYKQHVVYAGMQLLSLVRFDLAEISNSKQALSPFWNTVRILKALKDIRSCHKKLRPGIFLSLIVRGEKKKRVRESETRVVKLSH